MTFQPELLEACRRDTPGASQRIHFNNAGAALMPRQVLEAMQQHLALEMEIGGYEAAAFARRDIGGFYGAVARLLNTEPRNIAFTGSATDAYNKALSAIPFEPGDFILTTNDDYVSNQIAFMQAERRFGARLIRAAVLPEGGVDPDSVEQLIRQYTPKLVAVTHMPTNSGLVQPIETIGRICRQHSCFYLVDACQSAGQAPLDVQSIHCDFLSATFRKFLRGPRGAGFLYVSSRVLDQGLAPLFLDLHSADWIASDAYQLHPDAYRFELWERSYALVLGSKAAAEYALQIGLANIQARVGLLAATLRERLANIPGLLILDRGSERSGIVSVHVPGRKPLPLKAGLEARRINSSISSHNAALIDFDDKGVDWALRFSPHYYNSEAEVDAVVNAMETLVS